jgi:magnesium chelatase family protein
LIGGGTYPQPGEVSLAHHGILFLDELTEFKRATLEALRQPLEERSVSIARVNQTIQFPASFLLIAALNPCPCGYFGDKTRTCICSRSAIQQYLSKISGPLLDRIDLQIPVAAIDYNTIKSDTTQISTATLKKGVEQSIHTQKSRFGSSLKFNATMRSDEVERFCTLSPESEQLMKQIFEKYKLSMRGYHKLLKVARTIADIEQSDKIYEPHIMEASMYRCLDQYLEQNNSL